MKAEEFVTVLRRFADKFATVLEPAGENAVELRIAGVCPKVRKLLEWTTDREGEVDTFLYSCFIGRVTSPTGFRELLLDNNSGHGGTPFYSSIMNMHGGWIVQLETRQVLLPDTDADYLFELLTRIIAHPIFLQLTLGTESTTEGVELISWTVEHRPRRQRRRHGMGAGHEQPARSESRRDHHSNVPMRSA